MNEKKYACVFSRKFVCVCASDMTRLVSLFFDSVVLEGGGGRGFMFLCAPFGGALEKSEWNYTDAVTLLNFPIYAIDILYVDFNSF